MNPLILGSIFEIGKTLLDRFVPDPEKKREAEMEMFRMAADGELKQVLAQLEINAREAQHPSIFVSGWRPAAGWCGVAGLAYTSAIYPLAVWFARVKGWPEPPVIESELLWVVLTGLLGIGGLRSVDKWRGVETK